jgi:hypothetical protein
VKDKADSPLYRGCTLGERDGVLRVCLPNGLYRLTYHFMGIPNGRYQVNVRANDASILAGLVVTPACASNSAAGRVEVKNGRLDQVFYTTWRKSNDLSRQGSWALGGVEIEQDR